MAERDAEIVRISGEFAEIHKIQKDMAVLIDEQSPNIDTLVAVIKGPKEPTKGWYSYCTCF